MPSNTVLTGVATAFYALLRYVQLLFAALRRGRGDIESGLAGNTGVAASDSQDTSSSSFHCRGIDDSIVWSGPYIPNEPQATSTPKRASRSSSSLGSPKEETQDIGCLSIPSIEPQACRPVVSDGPVDLNARSAPSVHTAILHVANPDDADYVLVEPPSQVPNAPRTARVNFAEDETTERPSAQATTKPVKSSSFSANRGYNKFIPLHGIAATTGTHWAKKPSKAPAIPVPTSAGDAGTPFSQMGTNTPLPRYTPTGVLYGSSVSIPPLTRAPSYTSSKTSPPRGVKRKVTIAYVAPQKATMNACEPLTPPLVTSIAASPNTKSIPPHPSPPVNSLVAEVLSRLRRGSPEAVPGPSPNLRPLILPQDVENRSPVLSTPASSSKPATRRPRPLLLPQQLADRAALRLSSVDEEPRFDDLSVRSMSIYSQMSWQIIGSSTSLACTVGSDNDLQVIEEIGLHPALKDWVPTHKRRAMCMPDLPMSQRL